MRRDKLISLLVDDVLSGEVVKFGPRELSAFRLINDSGVEMWVDSDELACLLTGNDEQVERVRGWMREHLAEKARAWLEANEELVSERLDNINAEEREAA